jgi:proline iminopeptidase
LEQWNVLGFSYGGYLASLYTAFYPSSVSSLVLLSSMGLNTDVFAYFGDNITSRLWESDVASSNYWRDSARVAQNPKHALAERIRARMPGYFYDRKKSLIVSQAIKDSDFDVDMGNWVWNDVVKRNLDLTTMKTDFGKPVLILHGRQDPLGESVPQALSRYYKDSKLVFIEKCGHYSWVEQPEKVYAAIKSFLSGSYPGKKGR